MNLVELEGIDGRIATLGLTHPRPEDLELFRTVREAVRIAERLPGQCHLVTDWISEAYGWERMSGTYMAPCGIEPAGDGAHYWNRLPDGSILDPTADQLGEDADDVRVLAPADPRHGRYVDEWSDDWHPGLPEYDASGEWQKRRDPVLWRGVPDWLANDRMRHERGGDRWWYVTGDRRHVDAYLAKCSLYDAPMPEGRTQ